MFDLIRQRAGVSLGPAGCHQPWHKSPHLFPGEINTAPSSSLFSHDEKTRSETERCTDTSCKEGQSHTSDIKEDLTEQSGLRSPRLISCGHRKWLVDRVETLHSWRRHPPLPWCCCISAVLQAIQATIYPSFIHQDLNQVPSCFERVNYTVPFTSK